MNFTYPKKFTAEEWAEISREIPSDDDPHLRKYLEGRENLIAQEDKQRSGSATPLPGSGRYTLANA